MLDLEPIKRRAEAATEGPWVLGPFSGGVMLYRAAGTRPIVLDAVRDGMQQATLRLRDHDRCVMVKCDRNGPTYQVEHPDAKFIAHAREDVPALVAEVEAERAENRRLRAALAAEREAKESATATKDAAYHERDQVVAALAALASISGWPVWLAKHVGPWEDDWRNIVFIGTPHGQVSWHYHDSERDLFSAHRSDDSTPWDGHSTDEKYARLSRLNDDARRAAEQGKTQ